MDIKKYNRIIPYYLNNDYGIKRGLNNSFLCPACNSKLIYYEDSDYIECSECDNIRGAIRLIMFNEKLNFSDALAKADKIYKLAEMSETDKNKNLSSRPYELIGETVKRFNGLVYENDKNKAENFYKSDFKNNALVFASSKGEFFYHLLLARNQREKTPNIITISNIRYVNNAISVLLHTKANHKLKIFLAFDFVEKDILIKNELLKQLKAWNFYNIVIANLRLNYETIDDFYKKDTLSFAYYIDNYFKSFNAYYRKSDIEEVYNKILFDAGEEKEIKKATTPAKAKNKKARRRKKKK